MTDFIYQKKNFYKAQASPHKIWLNKELVVQLNLTSRCKLNCEFCYIKDKFNERILSLRNIKDLWINLRKYNKRNKIFYRVNLTGGDVFLNPEWKKICEFLAVEKSVIAVDPLINRFWKKEHVNLLKTLKKKISYIQMNSDVVTESDIKIAEKHKKTVVLKFAFYKGSSKKDLKKMRMLTKKFKNVVIGIDLIIPQKNNPSNKYCLIKNINEIRREYLKLKRIFRDKFWVLNTTLKREFENEIYLCPVPFGGIYIMPNGKVVPCSRYPHLDTKFTIKNFDLIKYVTKYNKLVSNYCLFENKYFKEFWHNEENPINFLKYKRQA